MTTFSYVTQQVTKAGRLSFASKSALKASGLTYDDLSEGQIVGAADGYRAVVAASDATEYDEEIGDGDVLLYRLSPYDTVEDMIASYAPSQGYGTVIEAGGYRFETAVAGVTDYHLSTAGGALLYGTDRIVAIPWDPDLVDVAWSALDAGWTLRIVPGTYDDAVNYIFRDGNSVALDMRGVILNSIGNGTTYRGGALTFVDNINCHFELPQNIDASQTVTEAAVRVFGGRGNVYSVGGISSGHYGTFLLSGNSTSLTSEIPADGNVVVRREGILTGQRYWGGSATACMIVAAQAKNTLVNNIIVQGGLGDYFDNDNAQNTVFMNCQAINADEIVYVDGTTEYTLQVNNNDDFDILRVMRWRPDTEPVVLTDYTRDGDTLTLTDVTDLDEDSGDRIIVFGPGSAGFWNESDDNSSPLDRKAAKYINCTSVGMKTDFGVSQQSTAVVEGLTVYYACGAVGNHSIVCGQAKFVDTKFFMPMVYSGDSQNYAILTQNGGAIFDGVEFIGGYGGEQIYSFNSGTGGTNTIPTVIREIKWKQDVAPRVRYDNGCINLILDNVSCYVTGDTSTKYTHVRHINTQFVEDEWVKPGHALSYTFENCIIDTEGTMLDGTANLADLSFSNCRFIAAEAVMTTLNSGTAYFDVSNEWPDGGMTIATSDGVTDVLGTFRFLMPITSTTAVDIPFCSEQGVIDLSIRGDYSTGSAITAGSIAKSVATSTTWVDDVSTLKIAAANGTTEIDVDWSTASSWPTVALSDTEVTYDEAVVQVTRR